jgi:protein-disulfide isomerase
MKAVPADQRGTPYSVIVGTNGAKTEIRGADTIDNVKKLVAEVTAGKVTTKYTGDVPPVDPTTDHIFGNPAAPVTIIEYSDFECPYCARFQPILEQVVNDSNGGVNWVFRNWPIHNSITKLIAAECVAKIKGNDAYWKYGDLLFKLIAPTQAPATDNNL